MTLEEMDTKQVLYRYEELQAWVPICHRQAYEAHELYP